MRKPIKSILYVFILSQKSLTSSMLVEYSLVTSLYDLGIVVAWFKSQKPWIHWIKLIKYSDDFFLLFLILVYLQVKLKWLICDKYVKIELKSSIKRLISGHFSSEGGTLSFLLANHILFWSFYFLFTEIINLTSSQWSEAHNILFVLV